MMTSVTLLRAGSMCCQPPAGPASLPRLIGMTENESDDAPGRQASLVAAILLLLGATMVFVGVSLVAGPPTGLIVLGGLLLIGGLLLGFTA